MNMVTHIKYDCLTVISIASIWNTKMIVECLLQLNLVENELDMWDDIWHMALPMQNHGKHIHVWWNI